MREPIVAATLAVGLLTSTACAGEASARVIDIKGFKPGKADGKVSEPKIISSNDELAKAIADEETQAAVKKQVDFAKEKLLYFSWSGSGGDKLTFSTAKSDKGVEVIILLTPGLTRDLRMHHQLIAIPKDASWRFEVGNPGK
jgi:hypothetical protein